MITAELRQAIGAAAEVLGLEVRNVTVRIGDPIVEGARVAGEFWATGRNGAIAGGFVAHLGGDGRCTLFREYWFELDAAVDPFQGWGV